MAALQLLAMEQPLRVVALCPAPGKPHTPARSTEVSRIMDTNEKALLQQMVEMIVREVAPETIILFGSRARGDARPDSDIDLLVVEKKPFSPQRSRRKEAARLYMALRGLADGWSVEDIIESYPHITREDF